MHKMTKRQGFTHFEHDYYFLIKLKLFYSNNSNIILDFIKVIYAPH